MTTPTHIHLTTPRRHQTMVSFGKARAVIPKGDRAGSSRGPQTSALKILRDKTVTVTKGAKLGKITVKEALQQRIFQNALAGKRMAVRVVLKWIERRRAWFAKTAPQFRDIPIIAAPPDPDNADAALVLLGIAGPNPDRADSKFDRAQLLLEPWAVQMALSRGSSPAGSDRETVLRCTREANALRFQRS